MNVGTQASEGVRFAPLPPLTDADRVLRAARQGLAEAAPRLAELLRSLPHLGTAVGPGRSPPGSGWTVRDTAAHLISWGPALTAMAAGAPSPVTEPGESAAVNARLSATVDSCGGDELADLVEASTRSVLDAMVGPADRPVLLHGGVRGDLAALAGLALGELVVHGYDIALATRRPWPIRSRVVGPIVYVLGPGLAELVEPAPTRWLNATVELDLGAAGRFPTRFTDGIFAWTDPARGGGATPDPDCVLQADPRAFLLVLTGRLSVWTAVALGQWQGEGRCPELATDFPSWFRCL